MKKSLPGLAGWALIAVVATASSDAAPDTQSEKHWSFRPPKKAVPPADSSGWSKNPIDRFISMHLQERGLRPAKAASKNTLLRRLTFDLTGLPPTPEELDAFLSDQSPYAYTHVVDRLLASEHYGERWARHWLDAARYSDTTGFETDQRYTTAWRYRDYVIRAFNADKPFNRFLEEQVAGDELWPGDNDAAIATGLYCVGPVEADSALNGNQLEHEWLIDAADTTGAVFLGLTLGCARCHDHKYDPIPQHDYYAMQAFFAASDRPYTDKIRVLRIKGLNGLLSDAPVPRELLHDQRCTLVNEDRFGSRLLHRPEPLVVHRLHRGELSKPRETTEPAFLSALTTGAAGKNRLHEGPGQRRAALAKWLTAPENPLSARVLVNRIWGWHFGQALVRTPNDFGLQGEPPTHPALLDWLACDFVEHGWSIKRLHRMILLSNTYQMQVQADGQAVQEDAENRLLSHFPRQRLEGEEIRDAMLVCAGNINIRLFGSPVVPPLSDQELMGLFGANEKWQVTKDSRQHTRRSVYLLTRRTFVYPMFAAFDPPEIMTSCPQRLRTVVPTQALTLLNSPLARAQADVFAKRLLGECGPKPADIVKRAWKLAFAREATPAESERAIAFLQRHEEGSLETPLGDLCLALFNANEFIFVE
jgi:hypothetical protein